MVLITGHRRESFGEGMQRICQAIRCLANQHHDVEFLYPVHLNPRVSLPVRTSLAGLKNIHLVPPVSYREFIWLMDRSTLILTDSGGVQEEALSLGKPVMVMRDTTERPEAIEAGVAELVGTSVEKIVRSVNALLTDPAECDRRRTSNNPYGDGHAAERIVDLVVGRFGR
jgi:UDP-N-acetylglucosamine 2-epimerase (non-hydrolysing)